MLIVILLFVNGAFTVMINHLTTFSLFSGILQYFNALAAELENFLYAADKIHILSLTFAALIVVSIFFGSLFILLKLLSFFFKSKPSGGNDISKDTPQEADEQALEFELQSELEKNDASSVIPQPQDDIKKEREEELSEEEEIQKEFNHEQQRKMKESSLIELDWQKSKGRKAAAAQENEEKTLAPISLRKNIRELISMVVNMLGRNIDELKVAQALMYRGKDALSEESVLQLVFSIKEFLSLCRRGAFDNVRRLKDLPDDEECILHLIAGDTSYAMALLESLMDERINQAVTLKNDAQRTTLFKEASKYACCFGTLAEMTDTNLATASFELAVEMYPENTLAWSRCADLYKQAGWDEKASWAYRNVLKIARADKDISQEANARKFLSQYLYAQGESIQASELYLQSKNYYDSIGINRPLDRKELEIIELIDNTSTENIIRYALQQQNVL